jgi:uncharacterized protein YehS (DUF1456 family)
MTEIFALAEVSITDSQITTWMQNEQDKTYIPLSGQQLGSFLNGFIILKRGKRETETSTSGKQKPDNQILEAEITNNQVFQKLRIALNLKAEDILHILHLSDLHLSKHELSAFFRKVDNKHYRECSDETLQKFFNGYAMLVEN